MASFLDDFTGTNGALLRLRSGWSFSGSAALQDRATISNNRVKCGGLGGASAHYGYVREIGDTQQFIEAKFLRNTSTGCSLYARWTSDSNFIGVRNSGSNVELIKRVAGVITSVASVATGLVIGDIVRLELRGTNAKLFKNGAQIGAVAGYTIADAVLQGATKVGLGGEGAAGSVEVFDDVAGGGLTVGLAPADALQVVQSDAATLTFAPRAELAPMSGRSGSRAGVGGILLRLPIGADDGQSGVSGTALLLPPIGPPGTGETSRIGADGSTAVFAEGNLARIGAD